MLEPDARICSVLGMLAAAAVSGCVGVPERSTPPTESRADEIIAEAMRETAKANRIAADLNEAVELVNAAAFGFAGLRLDYAAGSMELRYPIHE